MVENKKSPHAKSENTSQIEYFFSIIQLIKFIDPEMKKENLWIDGLKSNGGGRIIGSHGVKISRRKGMESCGQETQITTNRRLSGRRKGRCKMRKRLRRAMTLRNEERRSSGTSGRSLDEISGFVGYESPHCKCLICDQFMDV